MRPARGIAEYQHHCTAAHRRVLASLALVRTSTPWASPWRESEAISVPPMVIPRRWPTRIRCPRCDLVRHVGPALHDVELVACEHPFDVELAVLEHAGQ